MPPDFDEDRELCIDGACVGLIAPDGRCKLCGLAAREGTPYREIAGTPPDERVADAADADDVDDALDASDANGQAHAASGDEWADRRLCPDGACVGVIGPDGRCTICRAA